jgi:predicted aldo/keto reductase-like oxidoreductase
VSKRSDEGNSSRAPVSGSRRSFLITVGALLAGAGLWRKGVSSTRAGSIPEVASAGAEAVGVPEKTAGAIPVRSLGRTGRKMTLFGLGGQSALQHGTREEGLAVIQAALEQRVDYYDTSPKYGDSERVLGEGLDGHRSRVFLAGKTHERDADGSMRLLERSLTRLRTDHLDLWQIHSLTKSEDVDRIFAPDGAYRALLRAKEEGLVKHIGVTGHYEPGLLLDAISRERFDCILMALNAADPHHRPFTTELLETAVRKGMGVIGMKVPSRGKIFREGGRFHRAGITEPSDAFGYVWSLPVSGIIVGCDSPEQVARNADLARRFRPLSDARMRELEGMTKRYAYDASWFKNWNGVPVKRLWHSSWS